MIHTGATYQMIVNKLFTGMIGMTMKSYMDDMLLKLVKRINHVEDMRNTFECMRLHKVRLNPVKRAFGVQSGQFIGYMVSQRGIKVNLETLESIEGMYSSTCHREVQSLNGILTTLSHILSKSGDKSLIFFEVLQVNKQFE